VRCGCAASASTPPPSRSERSVPRARVGMLFGMPWTSTEPSLVISMRTDAATASQSMTGGAVGRGSGAAWTGRSPAAAGAGGCVAHSGPSLLVVAACRSLARAISMAAPGNYPDQGQGAPRARGPHHRGHQHRRCLHDPHCDQPLGEGVDDEHCGGGGCCHGDCGAHQGGVSQRPRQRPCAAHGGINPTTERGDSVGKGVGSLAVSRRRDLLRGDEDLKGSCTYNRCDLGRESGIDRHEGVGL